MTAAREFRAIYGVTGEVDSGLGGPKALFRKHHLHNRNPQAAAAPVFLGNCLTELIGSGPYVRNAAPTHLTFVTERP